MTASKLTECPPRTSLEALAAGELSIETAAPLREHAAYCTACRDVLGSIGSDLEENGTRKTGEAGSNTAPRTAYVAADQNAVPTTESPKGDATGVGSPPVDLEATTFVGNDLFSFLGAPQEKDELGRLGGYRVLRVIGQGGMGIVFEAEDVTLGRHVALKCLRPDLAGESIRKRFLQEARIAASLPHDHIVTIFQVGEEKNVPYLAMEHLTGETVATRLKREYTLPLTAALRITREVAEGLQAAHARGLIHRDVKPGNVFLETGEDGETIKRVKLLDFGLAKPVHSIENLTRLGDVVGTPSYMSPEQACGLSVDSRTDLFSLGCMLYRMLTGETPFRAHNTEAVLQALVHNPAPDPQKLAPTMPPAVAMLLTQLLNKDPAGRPANAQGVIDRIRAIETGTFSSSSRDLIAPTGTVSIAAIGGVKRRLSWTAWLGAATITAAMLIGLAISYRHLLYFEWSEAEEKVHHASIVDPPKSPTNETPTNVTPVVPTLSPDAVPTPVPFTAGSRPIRVGVLHSATGPMSSNESKVADIVLMAIDEINQQGGLLGRKIEPIVLDGRSRDEVFAACAEELIKVHKVSAIFGCWTSSSRKSVQPVVQKYNNLLFYPLQNEGLEESPNIVYLGACPNQQMLPAMKWCFAFLDKRKFFMVGTDIVYSHAANEIMRDELKRLGAEVVGEKYVGLDGNGLSDVIASIVAAQPEMIINTINGDSNIGFFRRLRQAGITPDKVPTISFSLTENSLRAMDETTTQGDYGVWCYFQSINTPNNLDFLKRCRARFGSTRAITDPMEVSYCGVYLWRQAVSAALSDTPADVRTALMGHAIDAPEGKIRVDQTQYCWRTPRIGRISDDHEYEEVWVSPRPVQPEPFPPSRTREQWEAYLKSLYESWGNEWHNPKTALPRETSADIKAK